MMRFTAIGTVLVDCEAVATLPTAPIPVARVTRDDWAWAMNRGYTHRVALTHLDHLAHLFHRAFSDVTGSYNLNTWRWHYSTTWAEIIIGEYVTDPTDGKRTFTPRCRILPEDRRGH